MNCWGEDGVCCYILFCCLIPFACIDKCWDRIKFKRQGKNKKFKLQFILKYVIYFFNVCVIYLI